MKYSISIILAASLVTSVSAQTIVLEPIVVQASSSDDLPNETIENFERRITIQETSPGFSNPVLNGLQGDQLNLSLDGIKFSNSLFRSGPNQYYSWIPDDFVSAVNVSTMGNLGGTIDRSLGIDSNYASIDYSTADSGHHESVNYKDSKLELGISNTKTSNVIDTSGEVEHSGYNQKAVFAAYDFNQYGKTKFLFSRSDDIDRTDKFESGKYYVYDLQQYTLLTHNVDLVKDILSFVPSYQQFKEKIDQGTPSKYEDTENNILGYNLIFKLPVKNVNLTAGVEQYFENIDAKTGSALKEYNYDTVSFWTKYRQPILSDLYLDGLYRYSHMSADGYNSLNRSLDNHSYGLELTKVTNRGNAYLGYTTSYRFPTIVNLAEARNDSVTEISNPNLDQEKSGTFAAGFRSDKFGINIFYKRLTNMILRTKTNIPDGSGGFKWQYNNVDNGYVKGISAYYKNIFKNGIVIDGYVEIVEGKTDYDYISKLTPMHFDIRASKSLGVQSNDNVWVNWKYSSSVDEDEMSQKDAIDIRIKDHNVGVNVVNVGYSFEAIKNGYLETSINNILDNESRVYGSSVDIPGRNLKVGFSYFY